MTRARDTANTQENIGGSVAPMVAGKNKVINGNMAIAQRGTSISVGSASYTYTLDRFKTYSANTATTVSRDTSAPTGFSYSLKLQRPNANTGTNSLSVVQIIETENVMALQGKIATISFYIKKGANYSGGNITVQGLTGTGTDQGGDPYSFTGLSTFVNDSSYSPTTSFVRVTYTGTIASSVKEIAVVITYTPTGTAGADDAIYVTGIQLEAGSVATPFTTASGSIGGELGLCQRYYWRTTTPVTTILSTLGTATSTTVAVMAMNNPVPMRVTATSIDYSGLVLWDSVNGVGVSSASSGSLNGNPLITQFNATASGLTQFRPYYIYTNVTNGYIGFSAEL